MKSGCTIFALILLCFIPWILVARVESDRPLRAGELRVVQQGLPIRIDTVQSCFLIRGGLPGLASLQLRTDRGMRLLLDLSEVPQVGKTCTFRGNFLSGGRYRFRRKIEGLIHRPSLQRIEMTILRRLSERELGIRGDGIELSVSKHLEGLAPFPARQLQLSVWTEVRAHSD